MTEVFPDVAELVPHRPPMRLIDRVRGWEGDFLAVEVDIAPDTAFYRAPGGVPAWVGLEYLGQAAAAYFALAAADGGAARPGMLVSCRRYASAVAAFPEGVTVVARVRPASAFDGEVVKFAGEIDVAEQRPAVTGEVVVYMEQSV